MFETTQQKQNKNGMYFVNKLKSPDQSSKMFAKIMKG